MPKALIGCLYVLVVLWLCQGVRAADAPQILMVGVWDRAAPMIQKASDDSGISTVQLRVEDLLASGADSLVHVKLVLVLNMNADQAGKIRDLLVKAKASEPDLQIMPLDKRDTQNVLRQANLLGDDPEIIKYWRANGVLNLKRLLRYLSITYLGATGKIEPPEPVPDNGFYIPELRDRAALDFSEIHKRPEWLPSAPSAAIVIHQSFWIAQDTKVLDAQMLSLRRQGINSVAVFASSIPLLKQMILSVKPNVLIEDRHSLSWDQQGGKSFLDELNAPYLRPISMLGYTTEEWLADPQGLSPRDINAFMSLQESYGTLEPMVIGGLKASVAGFRLHEPILERIEHFSRRAAAWIALRQKANADKRVAIVYYNKTLGQDDLMRGSPTGAFLNGPESFVQFLPRMKHAGYQTGTPPESAGALIMKIKEQGRNIGPWAQGDLESEADKPSSVLIPLSTYQQWFVTKLSPENQAKVIKAHGPPPGRLMVVRRNGQPQVVIPTVTFGNVLLAPQPERGERQDEALLHSRDVPPPHNYLAFYWWLQDVYKPDVVVHWGTHGSLELLPGKDNGLCSEDWSDICTGNLLIANLWVMDNIGESILSRRRSYAVLVDHVIPPSTTAGLAAATKLLDEDIDKFRALQQGLVKQEFRRKISQAAIAQRFHEMLHLTPDDQKLFTDQQILQIHLHLHMLEAEHTPTTLHVLGQKPDMATMADYLVRILHGSFLEKIAAVYPPPAEVRGVKEHRLAWLRQRANAFVQASVLGSQDAPATLKPDVALAKDILARLQDSDREITSLLAAMEGKFIPAGPGPDPIRNAASVPAGRNLYALNPEEIPTKASWEVAVALVDEMLKTRPIRKIGMDLSGMSTMQDYGVSEAQILYLLGVRPIWDANNLAMDVELIPHDQLKHPRIDVFIAMGGHYRENFPTRIKLIDKAVRLAAQAKEQDNLVAQGSRQMAATLIEKGVPPERARELALARIFGTKPGNLNGTNILYLTPRSGAWDTDDQITSVYIDNMSFVYSGDIWGEKVDGLYETAIQNVDTISRVWASNMTSQLSNHHNYEYLGGLSMAIKKLTGRSPVALIADVRDPAGARVREFEEVLDSNMRSELLNNNWIKGMQKQGYAGAGHMAELVKNSFGWSVTRPGSISDATWSEIHNVYVNDSLGVGIRQFFEQNNPHAFQEIAATMLEANRKGYWHADAQVISELSATYAESVVKYGLSAGIVAGGNKRLNEFVQVRLNAPGKQVLASAFSATLAQSAGQGISGAEKVRGTALRDSNPQPAPGTTKPAPIVSPAARSAGSIDRTWFWWPIALGSTALLLCVIGFRKRFGGVV